MGLSMTGEFQLKSGHFGHYVMGLWILYKPLFLVVTPLQKRKQGCGPLSARCHKSPSSPLSLHWHLKVGLLITVGPWLEFWLSYRLPRIPPRLGGVEVFHYLSSPLGLCWHHGMWGGIITAGQWSKSLLSTRTPPTPLQQRRGYSVTAGWKKQSMFLWHWKWCGGDHYCLARMEDPVPLWHSLKPPWQGCWSALLYPGKFKEV